MPPLLKFALRRLIIIPITLLIVTALLYSVVMATPPEERASLYLRHVSAHITDEQLKTLIDRAIVDHGLDQPYLVQYVNWLGNLLSGEFGWSPALRTDVLEYLNLHMPVTAEITLYSLLIFILFGILGGVWASQRRARASDTGFRFLAFSATSIPSFILALWMISFFYVGLKWFAPGRLSDPIARLVASTDFHTYTGLITIDGLLNGRWDVTLDAFKHLVMPVITVSALHWATLSRVTRAAMIDEAHKDYVLAAQARGIPQRSIVWRHMLRNSIVPALTSSVLSAASLLGGVYIVEIIFGIHGVSQLITASLAQGIPDAPAALGFTVYNVIAVLLLMFVLDVLQAIVDPRIREKIQN